MLMQLTKELSTETRDMTTFILRSRVRDLRDPPPFLPHFFTLLPKVYYNIPSNITIPQPQS